VTDTCHFRKEVLLKGTTHVAVGFVDLGILLVGNLREKPGSKATQGPLVFCGYEACAFNCAKTAVLWQLLSQPSIDDEDKAALCVAQVRLGAGAQPVNGVWGSNCMILLFSVWCEVWLPPPHCCLRHSETQTQRTFDDIFGHSVVQNVSLIRMAQTKILNFPRGRCGFRRHGRAKQHVPSRPQSVGRASSIRKAP